MPKFLGTAMRQMIKGVEMHNQTESSGNQMFAIVWKPCISIHGIGGARQEMGVRGNTKASYLETGREMLAEKNDQDKAWQVSSAKLRDQFVRSETHGQFEEHLAKSQRSII